MKGKRSCSTFVDKYLSKLTNSCNFDDQEVINIKDNSTTQHTRLKIASASAYRTKRTVYSNYMKWFTGLKQFLIYYGVVVMLLSVQDQVYICGGQTAVEALPLSAYVLACPPGPVGGFGHRRGGTSTHFTM